MIAAKNSLVPQSAAGSPAETKSKFSSFISQDGVKSWINTTLGTDNGNRFITQMISAVASNPGLNECDQMTIISAALIGESLHLSPAKELGQFHLVPFKDNKNGRVVATPVIGWKGYVQLAIRSGQYKRLNVLEIKEGELKHYDPLTEELTVVMIEDEDIRDKLPAIGYYAMFEYLNGFRKLMYWNRNKMELHAMKYSKAYAADKRYNTRKSFWTTDFDSQALKTMVRQIISKWGMMSVEIQRAFKEDTFETEKVDIFEEEPPKAIANDSQAKPAAVKPVQRNAAPKQITSEKESNSNELTAFQEFAERIKATDVPEELKHLKDEVEGDAAFNAISKDEEKQLKTMIEEKMPF